jgi:hypothetical protein
MLQVGAREADEQELVALSMERALRELDTVIGHAFGMQERYLDPSAPERLAADRAVAAAARHAIAVTKALKVHFTAHEPMCAPCGGTTRF